MALSQNNLPVSDVRERRTVQRYSVDCPATLKMTGGLRDGRLSDLSEKGARLETAEPPAKGSSGLLQWLDQEHFGTIVWTKDGSCGISFERPIGEDIVARSGELVEIEAGPVAQFGKIPVASRGRRASLVTTGTEAENSDAEKKKPGGLMARIVKFRPG